MKHIKIKNYLLYLFSIFLLGCNKADNPKKLTVQQVIEKAIEVSGTADIPNKKLEFKFRDYRYSSIPTCQGLEFTRELIADSLGWKDTYKNGQFYRRIGEKTIPVSDSLANLYSESINSVFYFVQLPYRLQDEAAIKSLEGMETDSTDTYYKIKVSFQQEGGGLDYEDVYYYWIHAENFGINYLAYSFNVNGGGIRFRKTVDKKSVENISFLNYENYKPVRKDAQVSKALQDYLQGNYEFLSNIENSEIAVMDVELNCN